MHLDPYEEEDDELILLEDASKATLGTFKALLGKLIWGEEQLTSACHKGINYFSKGDPKAEITCATFYTGLLRESRQRAKTLDHLNSLLKEACTKKA